MAKMLQAHRGMVIKGRTPNTTIAVSFKPRAIHTSERLRPRVRCYKCES
jgi:hypothetical protein